MLQLVIVALYMCAQLASPWAVYCVCALCHTPSNQTGGRLVLALCPDKVVIARLHMHEANTTVPGRLVAAHDLF